MAKAMVAILGYGRMGLEMAKKLVAEDYSVIGMTSNPERRREVEEIGGALAESATEAVREAKLIITALPSASALQKVTEELAEACQPGSVVLETSTLRIADKEAARDKLAAKGVTMLDIPVLGTTVGFASKAITVFGSGDEAAWEQAKPLLETFSNKVMYLGEFGNGMKMKLVANQLLTIHNVSTAEAVLFATKLGIDPSVMLDAVWPVAVSPIQTRGPQMVGRSWDHTMMSHNLYWKDISIIRDELHNYGSPSPLFNATVPLYSAAIAAGHGDHDTSSVYTVLEQMAEKK